jgi:hypothetical protein
MDDFENPRVRWLRRPRVEAASCTRPCSICGKERICRDKTCSEEIHPCDECVLYAPRPWAKGWKIGEVKYADKLLGRIPVPAVDDSQDPEGTMGHIGRSVLWELLKRNKVPTPEMTPQEWLLWVLRGISTAMLGKRDQAFEEQIMVRLLRHYGPIDGMEKLLALAKGP